MTPSLLLPCVIRSLAPVVPITPATPAPLQFSSQEREDAVTDALAFVVNSMRHDTAAAPHAYGVHTNLIDNNLDTAVYTGGHHVTDEHMGLFLRVTALLQNQGRYDEARAFVEEVLHSPGYNVLAWSMHKDKLKPFLQPDILGTRDVWMAANAPLDDLRSIRGLFDGASAFGQSDSEALAHKLLNGLYWTSVTDRLRGLPASHPQYPGGILGFSWDWEDHNDASLTPPALGTGLGRLGADLIPVDYQDLGTLAIGARKNPRLRGVLASAVDMMIASEIPGSAGLFHNGLMEGVWTGDFEYQGDRQGSNLKVIQELWTALHLARVSQTDAYVLDATRRQAAGAAATRSYNFFKGFYQSNGQRIPEYLTFAGTDVADGNTGTSLVRGVENLFNGEARIYAQLARLALLMGDDAFAASVIDTNILTDRVTDISSPLYGFIGASTASANDAEAFNVLEALLTLCLEAQPDPAATANTAPQAVADVLQAGKDVAQLIAPVNLLGNDTDADDDVLMVSQLDATTTMGGTIAAQGSRWIYTPPSNFVGDDSFGYTMTDGIAIDTATATIQVIEGGGIALEITRDGDLSDWPAGHFVASDPDDISGAANLVDIREIHLTVQNNKLYLGYVNEGPVIYNWAYIMYFDADKDPTTGYSMDGIGADFIIEENTLQAYTGTGDDWLWQTVALVTTSVVGDTAELSVPLSAFGSTTQMRMQFIGDNTAYVPNGIGEDYVPGPLQWIHFDLATNEGSVGDPTNTGGGGGGIDGDLSDWSAGHLMVLDPSDVSGAANKLDLRELHVSNDADNLLLGYVNEDAVIYNYAYLTYLDTDSNYNTGFKLDDIGADYIIQDDMIQRYTGNGDTWSWTNVEPVSSAVQGTVVELSASLATIGNPTSMRISFYGDNEAYAGGSTPDYVPNVGGSGATFVVFNVDTTIDPNLDTDSDGMPNSYELVHGLNPNSGTDGALDLDGDGLSNADEFVYGTSPSDPLDRFTMTHAMVPNFEVTLDGKSGRTYTLQRSTTMTGVWADAASIMVLGADQQIILTDPAAPTARAFYRVKVDLN